MHEEGGSRDTWQSIIGRLRSFDHVRRCHLIQMIRGLVPKSEWQVCNFSISSKCLPNRRSRKCLSFRRNRYPSLSLEVIEPVGPLHDHEVFDLAVLTFPQSSVYIPSKMSDASLPGGSAPPIRLQTPAVDFIDNRLPRYHPAFEYQERFHDGNGNRLVAISSGWSSPTSSNHTVSFVPSDQAAKSQDLVCPAMLSPRPSQQSARQLPPNIEDMTFWGSIWPKAMGRLRETPEASGRKDKGFSIREAEKWADVTNTLNRARDKYNGIRTDGKYYHKVLGKIKRSSRRVGETVATPLQQVIKVVPSHPIATPVLGTLDLLIKVRGNHFKVFGVCSVYRFYELECGISD